MAKHLTSIRLEIEQTDRIIKLLVKMRVKKSEYIRVSGLVYTINFLEFEFRS